MRDPVLGSIANGLVKDELFIRDLSLALSCLDRPTITECAKSHKLFDTEWSSPEKMSFDIPKEWKPSIYQMITFMDILSYLRNNKGISWKVLDLVTCHATGQHNYLMSDPVLPVKVSCVMFTGNIYISLDDRVRGKGLPMTCSALTSAVIQDFERELRDWNISRLREP